MYNLNKRELFFNSFKDHNQDVFSDIYRDDLVNMIEIISKIGEPLEGNIFFGDKETDLSPNNLSPNFLRKRRTLALLAQTGSNFLEIGFNSGFSALLMLTANPDLRLLSLDLCQHKYTKPCFEYLKSKFGDRINLICGNSLETLPVVLANKSDYDVFIIDGGHSLAVAEADLCNVIDRASKKSLILFDDSDWPDLRCMLDFYLLSGKVTLVTDTQGLIHNTNQMFLRVL